MATISDVARRANVSIKTVSRVINQEPYVHERTRARVLTAMRELGFVANVSARRLASGRANAIGFIFHNPSWEYINAALQGVLQTGRQSGYDTVIHPFDFADEGACRGVVDLVFRGSVDGFIFTPPCDVSVGLLATLQSSGIPFVRITPGERDSDLPYVTADDRRGAYEMTRYLLELGHRRIGFILGAEIQIASQERLAGYCAALAEHGILPEPSLIRLGDFSFASGVRCAQELLTLRARPTAIFASNDDMAAGVLTVAHELGLPVPRELSVAGFDNVPLSWQVWPAVTSVVQPIHEMAVAATEILLQLLRGDEIGVQHRQLATELVIRASTDCPSTMSSGLDG